MHLRWVSLSKLQSFFWKISLNLCLIRLEVFNKKNSTCSTWPGGKAFVRCAEGPDIVSGRYLFLFASFLFFFFFFFFFPFSFHFRHNSFVVSIYSSQFLIDKFSSQLYLPFPPSPSRDPSLNLHSFMNNGWSLRLLEKTWKVVVFVSNKLCLLVWFVLLLPEQFSCFSRIVRR